MTGVNIFEIPLFVKCNTNNALYQKRLCCCSHESTTHLDVVLPQVCKGIHFGTCSSLETIKNSWEQLVCSPPCQSVQYPVAGPVLGSNYILTSSKQHPSLLGKEPRPARLLCHRSHCGYLVQSSTGIVLTWLNRLQLKSLNAPLRVCPLWLDVLRSFESFENQQSE